jgi:hypothetical protein
MEGDGSARGEDAPFLMGMDGDINTICVRAKAVTLPHQNGSC